MTVSTFQAFSFGEEGVGVIHRLSLPSLDFPVQVPLKKKPQLTSINTWALWRGSLLTRITL